MTPSQHSSTTRLHGLDTLRATAILLVMLYHLNMQGLLPERLEPVARVGWIGVDLFFVLSGFLIGSQLFKPVLNGTRPSLKEFYARRAFRILPAFVVVLLLYFFVPLWREAAGPYAGWQYATFTWNLLLLGYPEHRAFSHIWSLCVEEHFYLLFPLVLLLLACKPKAWKTTSALIFLVVGGIVLRAALLRHITGSADDLQGHLMMKLIYYPTYSRLDGLVVGVALAIFRTFRTQWWSRISRYAGTLALLGLGCDLGALWMCGFDYPTPDLPFSIVLAFPALACGFGLLVASAICDKGILRKRAPGASALAALAYSLYLTHKSVAHATHQLLPVMTGQAGWLSSAIYICACVGAASLLYFVVERPFIALRIKGDRKKSRLAIEREIRVDPAI